MTWQVSPKNKVNVFTDFQNVCRCVYEGIRDTRGGVRPALLSAAADAGDVDARRRRNKLLFEAGVSLLFSNWTDIIQDGVSADDIGIQELSTGLWYHANDQDRLPHRRRPPRGAVRRRRT